MSADNGIYVLCTYDHAGRYEYRVKHAHAIENIFQSSMCKTQAMLTLYFGQCEVLHDRNDAEIEAQKQYREVISQYGFCESEICFIFHEGTFPIVSQQEIKEILCL
jgi:hypothetical protein